MKIICVGRNYAKHIEEFGNERPEAPIIFTKPDTALLLNNRPFYYPDFSNDIHHEVEIVLRVSKQGKNIHKRFAYKYYDSIALGIDFTARDLQSKSKEKGLPWAIAKGFNGAAPISEFVPVTKYSSLSELKFGLSVNGESRQQGNTSLMIWDFDELIAYVSKFFMLKLGDLIFTGTPSGVASVKIGDRLEGYIEKEKFLDFEVR